jgi:hypothetical protein
VCRLDLKKTPRTYDFDVPVVTRGEVDASNDDDAQLLLELWVMAAPELISPVRRFVASTLRRVLRDEDLAYRMELASHELLDNATKYGLRRLVHLRITREACQSGPALELTLDNESDPSHIGRLERLVSALGHANDPMGHYLGLMHDSVPGALALGLARVRAEGELDLALSVEGGRVAVTVRAPLGDKA